MEIELSLDDVLKIAALVVNASSPAGMGFLHYQQKEYKPEDLKGYLYPADNPRMLDMDYVDGRMVKLYMRKKENGKWDLPEDARPDYQSWAHTFPTANSLLDALTKPVEAQ